MTRIPALRPLVALLLGTAAVVAVAAAPASAAIVDTDRVKLTADGFDYGTNWDTFGAPLNGGYLDWDDTGTTINPRLRGWLYFKNEDEECAWIQMQHFTAAGQSLALRDSTEWCATSDSLQQVWVTLSSYSHPDIDHVTVRLLHRTSSNTYEILDTETEWINP